MPHIEEIEIPQLPGASISLSGALAIPDGEGPWPAVVLVHEAFGLSEVMKRQVLRMAEAGYLALMPDLFTEGGARKCLVSTFRTLSSGEGRAFVDIESARQFLAGRADSTGQVGVLGFCMGGGFALAAAGTGFAAASANYGMLPKEIDEVLADACPIVGSYGGKDSSMKGVAAKLDETLTKLGIAHDVKEYPDAGHSFLNDEAVGPKVLRPVMKRFLGAGPNPEAAADTWKRIEAFFGEHLATPAK